MLMVSTLPCYAADPHTVSTWQNDGACPAMWFLMINSAPVQTCRRLDSRQVTHLQPKELAYFLLNPHPKMPNISLSRSEADDIAAYIATLKT